MPRSPPRRATAIARSRPALGRRRTNATSQMQRSGGPALVSVVQAADLWQLDYVADLGRHDRAGGGRVLVEGEMRAGAMVVVEVGREKSPKVALTEDDDVVEALAPYRADQALDEGVLPGRAAARSRLPRCPCP